MKKLVLAGVFTAMATASSAGIDEVPLITEEVYDPSFFVGLSWTFGAGGAGQAGISAKVLSSNKPDSLVATAGVTLNFDGSFGCDIGAGLNDDDATLTLSYDICQKAPQVGLGVATNDPETRVSEDLRR